jgi:hypothetical protein
MWIYKIKAKYTEHGFWKIPKNCVNAEWGNFEELLKKDDYREVKSAIVNWFNDTRCKGVVPFSINFNGHDCIYLQADKQMEEFYFMDYSVMDKYLLHHTNETEYNKIRKRYLDNRMVLNRKDKIETLKKLIKCK